MIDKEIKNKMSQIELHCIPKTKRRLMGMLDEEEKARWIKLCDSSKEVRKCKSNHEYTQFHKCNKKMIP